MNQMFQAKEEIGARSLEDLSVSIPRDYTPNDRGARGSVVVAVRGISTPVVCRSEVNFDLGGTIVFLISDRQRSQILGAFRDSEVLSRIEAVLPARFRKYNVRLGTAHEHAPR